MVHSPALQWDQVLQNGWHHQLLRSSQRQLLYGAQSCITMGSCTAEHAASSVATQQCSCKWVCEVYHQVCEVYHQVCEVYHQVCEVYHQVPHSGEHPSELNAIILLCVEQEVEQPSQEVTSAVCLTTDTSSAVSDVPQTRRRKIHIQCVQKDNM
jgi:hypothetical protein